MTESLKERVEKRICEIKARPKNNSLLGMDDDLVILELNWVIEDIDEVAKELSEMSKTDFFDLSECSWRMIRTHNLVSIDDVLEFLVGKKEKKP